MYFFYFFIVFFLFFNQINTLGFYVTFNVVKLMFIAFLNCMCVYVKDIVQINIKTACDEL